MSARALVATDEVGIIDLTVPILILEGKYRCHILRRSIVVIFLKEPTKRENLMSCFEPPDIFLYTICSLMDNSAGAGIYLRELIMEISLPLRNTATVPHTVVYAIMRGVDEAQETSSMRPNLGSFLPNLFTYA